MTPAVFCLLAVAGGFGSVCRVVLDGIITGRRGDTMPWGTIVVNVTGSFALGLLTGLTANHLLSDTVGLVVGTGFLGGWTTFSTASFETVRLIQQRRWFAGLLDGLGVLVVATAAAGLGLWVGGWF